MSDQDEDLWALEVEFDSFEPAKAPVRPQRSGVVVARKGSRAADLIRKVRDEQVEPAQVEDHTEELRELRAECDRLRLQLQAWGIPEDPDGEDAFGPKAISRFFSPLVPLRDGVDEAPVILRGDLSVVHLTSFLSFIEGAGLDGVLTVICDKIATKLYIKGPAFRLAAWNQRNSPCGLLRLLALNGHLSEQEAREYEEEELHDLELANRLIYEGRFGLDVLRGMLREFAQLILTAILNNRTGTFFFQEARPGCEEGLMFSLPITDSMLCAAKELDDLARGEAEGA